MQRQASGARCGGVECGAASESKDGPKKRPDTVKTEQACQSPRRPEVRQLAARRGQRERDMRAELRQVELRVGGWEERQRSEDNLKTRGDCDA